MHIHVQLLDWDLKDLYNSYILNIEINIMQHKLYLLFRKYNTDHP